MENNIPAYPLHIPETETTPLFSTQGMTILDHFAAQALPHCQQRIDAKNSPENAAHWAYLYADAMLEARKQYIK
jgi:hypothetical protein